MHRVCALISAYPKAVAVVVVISDHRVFVRETSYIVGRLNCTASNRASVVTGGGVGKVQNGKISFGF